ncbi:hypothetical protein Tco_1139243, partial [Tanacetum coccineum]
NIRDPTYGHVTNSCHLDTTLHHLAVAVAGTMVAEVDTADSTGGTVVGCNQVGCRLLAVEHYKPQPYAQTMHDICPSDMTAYTPSALSQRMNFVDHPLLHPLLLLGVKGRMSHTSTIKHSFAPDHFVDHPQNWVLDSRSMTPR